MVIGHRLRKCWKGTDQAPNKSSRKISSPPAMAVFGARGSGQVKLKNRWAAVVAALYIIFGAAVVYAREPGAPTIQHLPRPLPPAPQSRTYNSDAATMIDEAALQAKANADLAAELSEIANLNGITFTMFLEEVE